MPLWFTSTRDESGQSLRFSEALRQGLAPDGGLYVPKEIPPLPQGWQSAEAFQDLAQRVIGQWLEGDLPPDPVREAVSSALSFPVRLTALDGPWAGVHVLELFHGPTLSFKDFGARTMARLLAVTRRIKDASAEPVTILVATSGDTGSAVADGFAGLDGFRVVLLFPEGQVSPVQERQLVVSRSGVTALRVRGSFDDCQRMVKEAFRDPLLKDVPLSSANSINIGRLLPQMLYYIWTVARLGPATRICVPSGNLGNLTAAVMASMAGMPVSGFVAAHNANRFFPDFLAGQDGRFQASLSTLSNAMDVGAPSNFERLRWLMDASAMRRRIEGVSVSDQETLSSMRRVYQETGYVADPHTAVGLEAVRIRRSGWPAGQPIVVASTAHPAKFPEAVTQALGHAPTEPEALASLRGQPTRVFTVDAHPESLRTLLLDSL